MKYRLGLDLGTNSIGWAVIQLNEDRQPESIVKAGSRIFSDSREPNKGQPSLAVARREARSSRRRRDRLLQRKKKLFNYLLETGFLPNDREKLEALKSLNPYDLRAKCVSQKVEKHELARALYHISQRRGFKSSRKDSSDKSQSPEFRTAIKNLENQLQDKDGEKLTLGEFYHSRQLQKKKVRTTATQESANTIHYDFIPTRKMYEDEVKKILETQKEYYPQIDDVFIKKIEDTIFFQRPLKPADIGFCQIYPKKTRAHRAFPSYQKYILEQDVHNLRIVSPTGEVVDLTPEQKDTIRNELYKGKDRTKAEIMKVLDLDDCFEFNLQKGKYKGLYTEYLLREKFFGKDWDDFSLQEKDDIVCAIVEGMDESKKLIEIAIKFKFNSDKQNDFLNLSEDDFKTKSYCHFSSQALIEAIAISEIENRSPSETIKILKARHNPETKIAPESSLPYYGKVLPESVVKRTYTEQQLSHIALNKEELEYGKIGNPTVHVVLRQTQKVVNRIIDLYGKPTEINLEIVRDLKMSRAQKIKLSKIQNENKKNNDRYRRELEEAGLPDTYTNRLKLKLWEELGPIDDRKCPYSYPERTINKSNLFSPEVEIEHILPFSRTLDDSAANKTVSYRSENRAKGDLSPFEAFGNNKIKYNAILARVQLMPFNKRKRFFANAMKNFADENGFLTRQLNDTAYIARVTRKYLSSLLPEGQVQVSPGKLTAFLRYSWGLDSIINEQQTKDGRKSRLDHRHHAIDAIVIALSDKGTLQKLSRENANPQSGGKIKVPLPLSDIRNKVKSIVDEIITSHKQDRGPEGKMHEETYYGIQYKKKDDPNFYRVNNQNFSDLKNAEELYKVVTKKWNQNKESIREPESSLKLITHGDGRYYKGVIPGENYKIEFWQFNNRISSLGISFFDINRLNKNKLSYDELRKANKIHPAAKKILEFYKGDTIFYENQVYLVVGLVPTSDSIQIRPINSTSGKVEKIKRSVRVLLQNKARKIYINELGIYK